MTRSGVRGRAVVDDPVRRRELCPSPVASPVDAMLSLQGHAGNRAVDEYLRGSAGRPLDTTTRTEMEALFGRDFGGVRVHDGPAAEQAADRVGAVGYTVGRHVVLGRPSGNDGRALLAHELAHVAQQGPSTPDGARAGKVSRDAAGEQEAHRAAETVARGGAVSIGATLAPGVVARQAKPAPAGAVRFSAEKEALTQDQIAAIWRQSANLDDFKLRLLGPVSDETLVAFLNRKMFVPPGTATEQEAPYPGPSAGPYTGPPIVGRIIYFTHPDGGTVAKYVRGTAAELDELQAQANAEAGRMMAEGLATAAAGLPAGGVRSTKGMSGSTAPAATVVRKAPPPPPAKAPPVKGPPTVAKTTPTPAAGSGQYVTTTGSGEIQLDTGTTQRPLPPAKVTPPPPPPAKAPPAKIPATTTPATGTATKPRPPGTPGNVSEHELREPDTRARYYPNAEPGEFKQPGADAVDGGIVTRTTGPNALTVVTGGTWVQYKRLKHEGRGTWTERVTGNVADAMKKFYDPVRNRESASKKWKQPDGTTKQAVFQNPARLLLHVEVPGLSSFASQERADLQAAADHELKLWCDAKGTYEGLPVSVVVVEAP
ncbi:eCIS core domain-containing protein [Pseudonocardia charpentierae]|uniref:DUF4157 domain-containing protein n=1 Tax=Pseudonocardia charpentierae TaxID=3075545 RepID=A0ABU2NGR3_9PSEU|nr:DUF4157 domain-containing protein [Pseudonocardia sp. DSM 45834]MDT0353145.1 DUF4157 domain-containing protein [Pseudonocardia sp. DSM 45834]